jgi:two-component system sensor histidine kinase HydH
MPTTFTLLARNTIVSPNAARLHAYKNCLAVVCAVHSLLDREVTGAARERLARATKAVFRMNAMLEDELTPGTSSASPHRVAGQEFCVAKEVVEAVIDRVEDRADAGGVALFVECGPGGLFGIRQELVEALGNIVLNAIEMTPSGGVVSLVTHEAADGAQIWTVRDAGPGVPRDVMGRLGTPFCSSKRGGWGLGLAVTHAVVERHGGLLHFESPAEGGMLVSIWLPCIGNSVVDGAPGG